MNRRRRLVVRSGVWEVALTSPKSYTQRCAGTAPAPSEERAARKSMKSLIKPIFALLSLLGAFYLSISWRYGDPGWALEFRAAPRAQAQSEVVGEPQTLAGG